MKHWDSFTSQKPGDDGFLMTDGAGMLKTGL